MKFLGILGIFEILGIFRDFWDFWDFKNYFTELLTEKCESNFFGVITDVSTKIWICQPKEFLSANKDGMCSF